MCVEEGELSVDAKNVSERVVAGSAWTQLVDVLATFIFCYRSCLIGPNFRKASQLKIFALAAFGWVVLLADLLAESQKALPSYRTTV